MTIRSNYPGGFNAVTIRGLPLTQLHPGRVLWVSNASVRAEGSLIGGNMVDGGTFEQPFSTIDFAIGNAMAGRGDIIAVMPGYTQTISDATDLVMDVQGIAIVGLGAGSTRPTLTFGAPGSNIPVTAADMTFTNMLVVNNFADVASNFTATSTNTPTDLTIEGCEFRDTTSILNALTILTGNATANSLDGLSFLKNKVFSKGTTAATTAIVLAEDADRVTLNDNFLVHGVVNDTPALIECAGKNLLSLQIGRNVGYNTSTSSTDGLFVGDPGTGCTGMGHDNYFFTLDGSSSIWIKTGSGLGFIENYSSITGAADKNCILNPAVEA